MKEITQKDARALLKALRDVLGCANVRVDDPRIDVFDGARELVRRVRQ